MSVCVLASLVAAWKTDLGFELHGPLCFHKAELSLLCVAVL